FQPLLARDEWTADSPASRATVYAPSPALRCAASHSHDARGGPANPDGTRKFVRSVYARAPSLVGLGPTRGDEQRPREISGVRRDSARGSNHGADTMETERDELDTITLHDRR